jgi:DNA polymerase (family 10)
MDKKEIIYILEEIGIMLDLKGENPFKSRAYFNAARTLESLSEDLNKLVTSGEISQVKGIGKALVEKIGALIKTGHLPYYEDLKEQTPPGLLEMLKIPGLGSKKVKTVYEQLNISSVGELEYACRENRLRDLDGFGQKSQDKILANIELHKKYSERFLYSTAESAANEIISYLQKNKKFIRLSVAGSLRRKKETVKDIDIVASSKATDRAELMDYYVHYDQCEHVVNHGDTKSSITLQSGINTDLRIVDDEEYPFILHHFTGSKEHNAALRALAKTMDMKINEYGIFKKDRRIDCEDESAIFRQFGLEFIPPELREDMGEIDAARNKNLPDLYTGNPFYGVLHVHTTYSDGANTLQDIVNACRKMNLQYVGICDHSKSAFYANGLTEERLIHQFAEIDVLNKKQEDFHIFKGIEVDILGDGTLDFTDDILSKCDFVIASVHSSFSLSLEAMTNRICRALENPYVSILGHPTGRLLLGREPYAVDMQRIITAAGKNGKAIEINSSPYRLDLDWRWGKLAIANGVKTALNPDAHAIEGLSEYSYGIGIARKAWFEGMDILNTYSTKDLAVYFTEQRSLSS